MKTAVRALLASLPVYFLIVSSLCAQPGLVDFTFNAGASIDFETFAVGIQSSGKAIVGGAFGSPSPGVTRLNGDGTWDSSFNAGGTGISTAFGYAEGGTPIFAVAVQPDDKIIIAGVFNTYNGIGRTNLARINADGTLDLTFDPGQSTANSIVPNVQAVCLQPDGKVLIGGQFSIIDGTNRLHIARLNANGSLDTSFNPGAGFGGGSGIYGVYALALQPDGKVLAGGEFTSINGSNAVRIARLNSDGSVDTTFNAGAGANNTVYSIAVQTNDNKILIGGNFTTVNNSNHMRIARLNADGSLDAGFNAAASANGMVNSILALSNGQIVLGGSFTTVNSTNRNRIARLNGDGSLDLGFNPGTGATSPGNPPVVNGLALQANGEVILGGFFTLFNGVARNFIARVNTDGSLDTAFNCGGTLDAVVNAVARQPDNKFIIGGNFTNINQTARNQIARLNNDGSLDTSFDPNTGVAADATVNAVALQSDGKVLIGGAFITANGVSFISLARLNQNGAVDTGYNPVLTSLGSAVNVITVEAGDKALIGGTFTAVNGTNRKGIARLNSDGTLDTSFNPGTGAGGVRAIVVETNNKIIIGGTFTSYNGTNRVCIAGLNDDGSLDTNFNVGAGFSSGSPNAVYALALQSDGKVLVGGNFLGYAGFSAESAARLNTDGTLDTNFNTRFFNSGGFSVYAVAWQPDGKVVLGGNFPQADSVSRNYFARLNSDGSLDTTFSPGLGAMAPLTPYVYSIALQTNGEIVLGGGFTTVNHTGRWLVARVHGDAPLFNPTGPTNGSLTLQWTAIPGRTYRVQYAPDSSLATWSNLPPDVVASTNTASKSDLPNNPQRFYRVSLLPLP